MNESMNSKIDNSCDFGAIEEITKSIFSFSFLFFFS